jgi:hypothetical protein
VNDGKSFEEELRELCNRHSVENRSHTPDFILAMFIFNALEAFNDAVRERDKWWGFEPWADLNKPLPGPPL